MLKLPNPQKTTDEIVTLLAETYQRTQKTEAVIAVSGGIDSALSTALLSRALGSEHIHPYLLPYGEQDMTDAWLAVEAAGIPFEQVKEINIRPIVDAISVAVRDLENGSDSQIRLGNCMARSRMILIFDAAKKLGALVCGTENKTEHHLAYFTRFGDGASDIEPIIGLYKTQVQQLAQHLGLPGSILTKAPSAGLWQGQTDEAEFGFSYAVADQVLEQLVDEKITPQEISVPGVDAAAVARVVARVTDTRFKHEVPYTLKH